MARGKKITISEEEFKNFQKDNLTDAQIAELYGCSISTISKIRTSYKLPKLKDNRLKIKLTAEKLQEYINLNYTDPEIANICNVSLTTVRNWRIKFGIKSKFTLENKKVDLSDIQQQVIFGSLLGDACGQRQVKNAEIIMQHSIKQKDYVDYLSAYFENCPKKIYEFLRSKDKRTGKEYNTYNMRLYANEAYNDLYDMFYPEDKKILPLKYLEEYYTPLAMAIHFFDDGYKEGTSGYNISTCSFTNEELVGFKKFLFNKYDLETTITKANRIYIRKCSSERFKNLILPYTPECMKYKLNLENVVS